MQELRKEAREAGVVIKVIKNRLVRVALASIDTYKNTDTSRTKRSATLCNQRYDEVAPAQVLDKFAKTHPHLYLPAPFQAKVHY